MGRYILRKRRDCSRRFNCYGDYDQPPVLLPYTANTGELKLKCIKRGLTYVEVG